MAEKPVVIVGAGIAGLVAASELAARGRPVTVVERAATPGGKLRQCVVGGMAIDTGPTVLTLRGVFDAVFERAGSALGEHLDLEPLSVLARHAWPDGSALDLFADAARSQDAIGSFAGAAEARRYARFCVDARAMFETLETSYLLAPRPNPLSLAHRVGFTRLRALLAIRPFTTLWRALGDYFHDPRLRQLFGRYATYCGASPFAAPATLMLIAHVEQCGVWRLRGGMHALALALQRIAEANGATFRFATEATGLTMRQGAVTGVDLADGQHIATDTVIINADINALAHGRFGRGAQTAVRAVPPATRSLSALTWTMLATASGRPLAHHTVCFSSDYAAEFDDLFRRGCVPREPTVYVCAQDRGGREQTHGAGPERLLCLINAPATADRSTAPTARSIARSERRAALTLRRCGIHLESIASCKQVTTPTDLEALFPATGGAIYGRATHGWAASFVRPGTRSSITGLHLAGGSVHPGPGLPMAAISGALAATAIHERRPGAWHAGRRRV